MADNGTASLLTYHDAAARRLLDRIDSLIARARTGDTSSRGSLRDARAQLAQHFADHQLLADAAHVEAPPRGWMRRALRDTDDDSLPALLRVMRQELAESGSSAA